MMAPDWAVILDFDQGDLYDHFTAAWPDMAITYTESTRRGFHVFFKLADGARPVVPGLIRGVEVKRFCLVHPSRVGGVEYEIMQPGPILTFSATRVQEALQPFLEPGGENIQPYPPAGRCASPGANQSHKSGDRRNHGMMAKVKAPWPILAYLLYFEPKLQLRGEGRWRSGKCPWHHDNKPSLWVDVERNTWGCHACGLHGDIVNWHALRLGVKDMVLTMRDLAGYNVTVWLE